MRAAALEGSLTHGDSYSSNALIGNLAVLPVVIGKMIVPLDMSPYPTIKTLSSIVGFVVILLLSLVVVVGKM